MRKMLTNVGPDLALVLDGSICDRLRLAPDAEVEVEISGETLLVRPAAPPEPDPIGDAFRRVIGDPELHVIRTHPALRP